VSAALGGKVLGSNLVLQLCFSRSGAGCVSKRLLGVAMHVGFYSSTETISTVEVAVQAGSVANVVAVCYPLLLLIVHIGVYRVGTAP
jgi:hypothetical protein